MAYGVKWFSEFADNGDTRYTPALPSVIYRVEILDRDFAGAATEVYRGGSNPFIPEMTQVNNPFQAIRAQKATIEWMSEMGSGFDISNLFITDDKKYQTKFYKYEGESLILLWWGYLVPVDCEEPFQYKPYPVTMAATCGLPFLSDDYYLDAFGGFVEGKKSLINLIANCLAHTGLELDIHTYIDLAEENMSSGSPLSQSEIDADGLRGMKALDVLEGIISAFDAFITQVNGVWVIKGLHEQDSLNSTVRKFSSSGSFIGEETVQQAASFGRNAYNSNTPWLTPTENVVEKFAEPNSIVTETVSPGIAVNRLANGQFSGVVSGGNIPGWNNHITGGVSWSRDGAGMPDNPFRLVFRSPTFIDPTKANSRYPITPDAYFDTGPIMINAGDFGIRPEDRTELKLNFAGALKMHNITSCLMFVSINESERKGVSWLASSGEWGYEIKNKSGPFTQIPVKKTNSEDLGYDDLDLQTFDVESKPITNYLKVSGEAVSYIRVRIYPGARYIGDHNVGAFFSVEDLSLTFYTGLEYEGEHKYQADGKLPIRDANEVDYTTIIADKIGIDTPEQSRDVNRVMTGYMTLAGGNQLTQAWKYPDDSDYEPIQKRSLRDRIRMLCGKRREIGGSFFGYDLRPDHSVFNRYDSLAAPTKFFTVTSWRWDVKNCIFDTTFHELDFSPLADEDIYLYDGDGGRRGNRMYRGASGGGSGTTTPNVEEIAVDAVPPLYFTVGIQEIKVAELAPLILSNHLPQDLEANVTDYGDWVGHVGIDRGDDGDELNIIVTAKPTAQGTSRVVIELIGSDGEDILVTITCIAVPATKFTHYLINTAGGGHVVVGKLKAGAGYLKPTSWKIETHVDGFHEGYFQSVSGPGASYSTASPYVEVTATDDADYETNALVGTVGTYGYSFSTFRNEGDPDLFALVKADPFNFTLYDAAYLAKAKFELWVGGSKLGDIDPNRSSAFNTEGAAFQVKMIIAGVLHSDAHAELFYQGTSNYTRDYTHSSVTDITYDLYSSTPSPQGKGYYELALGLEQTGSSVYDRIIGFTINEKKKVAEGGEMFLAAMRPGQSAYDVLGTLSLTGNLFTLPAGGWNAGTLAPVVAGTRRSHVLLQKRGSLVAVNTALYTGRPQFRDYTEDLDEAEYLIFDGLSSKDIDKIHANNTSFRLIITDEVDGAVSAIYQGDFSFGTLEDLEGLDVEEPGSKTTLPGRAMKSNPISSNVEAFDWVPDGLTLGIKEPESPNDPDNPDENVAEVLDGGITYAKFQDMPTRTVLGNMTTGTATPTAVTVAEVLEDADIDDLVSPQAIINYVTEQLENSITGTVNFVPIYGTIHTFIDSVIRQITGKIGIGVNPTEALHVAGSVLATVQVIAQVATGTAPLLVNSVTLVVNLNSDLLDGQHGPYYLNWDNFANYKSVIAGDGTTGGGSLSGNVTINIGTPSSITSSSTNSVSADSHTHQITSIDWDIVENAPTNIGGYGITDAYTKTQTDTLLGGKANTSHTHTASQITDFTSAGRALISGTGAISYNSSTGVISYSGSSGTVDGDGTKNRLAKWDVPGTGLLDSRVYDEGTGAVEVLASLQVSGGGKFSSTSEGVMVPRVTQAQRRAITSGASTIVYQTDVGDGGVGFYGCIGGTSWIRFTFDYLDS